MKRSSERILTTHIGSLPRPSELWTHVSAKDRGQPYDQAELDRLLKKAVQQIVRKQIGIDIPSDGEFSKASFTNYVRERLSGLEGSIPRGSQHLPRNSRAMSRRCALGSTWRPVLAPCH